VLVKCTLSGARPCIPKRGKSHSGHGRCRWFGDTWEGLALRREKGGGAYQSSFTKKSTT